MILSIFFLYTYYISYSEVETKILFGQYGNQGIKDKF